MKYAFALAASAAFAKASDYSSTGFTSIYNITASPDQVVNSMSMPAPGQPGAKGQFNYAINSKTNTICYDITLEGVTGDYQSLARTATHIHEATKGRSGPPRIALPNPGPITDGVRRSVGCLTGPFVTGIKGPDNTTDTGAGFTVAQIEANPAGFFTDSHTVLYVPGVVRGQLDQSFKIIEKQGGDYGYGYEDLSKITTATLTKTAVATIYSCAPTVTDCPYAKYPVVTTTVEVYTTVCPISELPYYTKPAQPYETAPGVPVYTKPAEQPYVTAPGAPVYTKPAEQPYVTQPGAPVYTQAPPADNTLTYVAVPPTGTNSPAASTSKAVEFTGDASGNKIGGALLVVAGLVAALL